MTEEQEALRQPCEVYSRVVGYIRPVAQYNDAQQEIFKDRVTFKLGGTTDGITSS